MPAQATGISSNTGLWEGFAATALRSMRALLADDTRDGLATAPRTAAWVRTAV